MIHRVSQQEKKNDTRISFYVSRLNFSLVFNLLIVISSDNAIEFTPIIYEGMIVLRIAIELLKNFNF